MYRYYIILLVIYAHISSSSSSPTFELTIKMINEKIVNGQIASREQFPYHVAIFLKSKNEREFSLCGGSLVHENVVLTAAHCLWNAENALIILGALDLIANETDVARILLNETDFKIHPKFDLNNAYLDIAIAIFPEPIKFNKLIKPVVMPSKYLLDESFSGETGTIAGHGKFCDSCGSSSVLRYSKNLIISNEACARFYPTPANFPSSTQICLSTAENKSGSCRGDSGKKIRLN